MFHENMDLRQMVLTFLCFSCINAAPLAQAAEMLSKFHPYISVREEYSDNLDLTSTNEKEDFFTTVQPGIKFSNMDEMAGVELDYSLGGLLLGKQQSQLY